MSDEQPARPPPRIIQVPPPKAAPVEWIIILGLFQVVLAVWALARCLGGWGSGAPAGLVVTAWVAALVVSARRCIRFNRARRGWLCRHEDWEDDPPAVEIERGWVILGLPPMPSRVCDAAVRNGIDPGSHALVAACGAFDLPQSKDYRFEPEVLTPARADSTSRPLVYGVAFAATVAAVAGTTLAIQVHASGAVIVGWGLGPFCLVFPLLLFWTRLGNPRDLRVAPGVVQVIT